MTIGSKGVSYIKKSVLALAAGLMTLLIIEGAHSFLTGMSIRARLLGVTDRRMTTDQERDKAVAKAEGPLRSHHDPAVSYYLKKTESLNTGNAVVQIDNMGMRVRPNGPAPVMATRIAVVGDSVAFGVGLNNNETIAYQLEKMLGEVRGPKVKPAICICPAMPGWNHRNSVQFFFDNYHILDPDIVIYIPVANDLADSFGVSVSGYRRVAPDMFSSHSLMSINIESNDLFKHFFKQKILKGTFKLRINSEQLGPFALNSDLTGTSQQRYDQNADSIEKLARFLKKRGKKLYLMQYAEESFNSSYAWILRDRLLDRNLDIPRIPSFVRLNGDLTMEYDPHPNPDTAKAMAIWIAETLLRDKCVTPGANNPMPKAFEKAVRLRAPPRSDETIRRRAHGVRAEGLAKLQSVINTETAQGVDQIYGGLNPDGTMRARFLAMLKLDGGAVYMKLSALGDRPGLYPLNIRVEINGMEAGVAVLNHQKNSQGQEFKIDFPQTIDLKAAFEIKLIPEHWTLHAFQNRTFIASARIHSIECR